MDIMLPYNNDLYNSYGAFILPNNDIEVLHVKHEVYAKEYVHDRLTDKEKELYKLWNRYFKDHYSNEFNVDFMFYILGIDKLQISYGKRNIDTTTFLPHMKYYEYYLRNWDINIYPKMIFNSESCSFVYAPKDENWTIREWKDRTYADEIDEIRYKRIR